MNKSEVLARRNVFFVILAEEEDIIMSLSDILICTYLTL